jgi:hypothetical protein
MDHKRIIVAWDPARPSEDVSAAALYEDEYTVLPLPPDLSHTVLAMIYDLDMKPLRVFEVKQDRLARLKAAIEQARIVFPGDYQTLCQDGS